MKKHVLVIALILIAALATPLFAQGATETAAAGFVPSKDIEWFVTSSPGGGSDIYTRIIADIMTRLNLVNGQTFLVTNKTDGGGEVGRLQVSRVTAGKIADHTLLTFQPYRELHSDRRHGRRQAAALYRRICEVQDLR